MHRSLAPHRLSGPESHRLGSSRPSTTSTAHTSPFAPTTHAYNSGSHQRPGSPEREIQIHRPDPHPNRLTISHRPDSGNSGYMSRPGTAPPHTSLLLNTGGGGQGAEAEGVVAPEWGSVLDDPDMFQRVQSATSLHAASRPPQVLVRAPKPDALVNGKPLDPTLAPTTVVGVGPMAWGWARASPARAPAPSLTQRRAAYSLAVPAEQLPGSEAGTPSSAGGREGGEESPVLSSGTRVGRSHNLTVQIDPHPVELSRPLQLVSTPRAHISPEGRRPPYTPSSSRPVSSLSRAPPPPDPVADLNNSAPWPLHPGAVGLLSQLSQPPPPTPLDPHSVPRPRATAAATPPAAPPSDVQVLCSFLPRPSSAAVAAHVLPHVLSMHTLGGAGRPGSALPGGRPSSPRLLTPPPAGRKGQGPGCT